MQAAATKLGTAQSLCVVHTHNAASALRAVLPPLLC
jgi:hypothetical protein